MSIIVRFRLALPKCAIAAALDAAGGTKATVERAMALDPDRPSFFLWVTDGCFARFQRALGGDRRVELVERLDGGSARQLYRVRVSQVPSLYRAWVERGAELLRAAISPDGWRIQMRFPERERLTDFREFCTDRGIEFRLEQLTGRDGGRAGPELTPAQREALETAFECGYFHVPRETTLAGVADRLGISEQAASERLRRGQTTIVEHLLAGGGRKDGF